jgi:hypothetical protein
VLKFVCQSPLSASIQSVRVRQSPNVEPVRVRGRPRAGVGRRVDATCRHHAWARVGKVGARDSSPQLPSFALMLSLASLGSAIALPQASPGKFAAVASPSPLPS